jgi:hypothetical protein
MTATDIPSKPEIAPAVCGVARFLIDRAGVWWHDGRPIRREPLVHLFATILRRDQDGFWLQTPVEREAVVVEDAPFLGLAIDATGTGSDQEVRVVTNIGRTVTIGRDHRLRVLIDGATEEPRPYVEVGPGLEARLVRSAFYHLVELATIEGDHLGVWSGGSHHVIDIAR